MYVCWGLKAHLSDVRTRNAPRLSLEQGVVHPENQASLAAFRVQQTSRVDDGVRQARRNQVFLCLPAQRGRRAVPKRQISGRRLALHVRNSRDSLIARPLAQFCAYSYLSATDKFHHKKCFFPAPSLKPLPPCTCGRTSVQFPTCKTRKQPAEITACPQTCVMRTHTKKTWAWGET